MDAYDSLPNKKVIEVCNNKIIPLLKSDSIRLIRIKWLFDYFKKKENLDKPIPRRQDLPEEAFLIINSRASVSKVTELLSFESSKILVLSYMWLDKDHPDPNRRTLNMLLKFFDSDSDMKIIKDQYINSYLFWDYASLFQKPRTCEQEKLFRQALDGMGYLYMHPRTEGLQSTKLPRANGENCWMSLMKSCLRNRNLSVPYHNRGWTYMENCWISLMKDRRDLHYILDRSLPSYPMLPENFDKKAQTLSFSNQKDDRELVKRLYKESLRHTLRNATHLDYQGRGWTSLEAQNVLDLFDSGYVPNVQVISFFGNQLDGSFGCQLAQVLENNSLSNLRYLSLGYNKIGDDGLVPLAPHLLDIEWVYLSGTCLSDRTLDVIAGELLLNHNDSIATGKQTNTPKIVRLEVDENNIKTIQSLVTIVKYCKSMTHLSIKENPICNDRRSMAELKQVCKESRVKLNNVPKWM